MKPQDYSTRAKCRPPAARYQRLNWLGVLLTSLGLALAARKGWESRGAAGSGRASYDSAPPASRVVAARRNHRMICGQIPLAIVIDGRGFPRAGRSQRYGADVVMAGRSLAGASLIAAVKRERKPALRDPRSIAPWEWAMTDNDHWALTDRHELADVRVAA